MREDQDVTVAVLARCLENGEELGDFFLELRLGVEAGVTYCGWDDESR